MNASLSTLLKRTAKGREIAAAIAKSEKLNGELLGKGFFSNIKKGLSKIGKTTGKITGSIAKIAAGIVGIPPSAIDALAKADPTAHKALIQNLAKSPAGKQAAAAVQSTGITTGIFSKVKPVYIVAGAAGIAAIIIVTTKKRR